MQRTRILRLEQASFASGSVENTQGHRLWLRANVTIQGGLKSDNIFMSAGMTPTESHGRRDV
jgi:hypothetical protein